MIALSHSNKEKNNKYWPFLHFIHFTLSGTSVACGRSIRSHNSLAPPPHAGHQPGHTLLWDGIPFLNQDFSQVSQHGCVGHSATRVNTTRRILQGILAHFLWAATHTVSCVAHSTNARSLQVVPRFKGDAFQRYKIQYQLVLLKGRNNRPK